MTTQAETTVHQKNQSKEAKANEPLPRSEMTQFLQEYLSLLRHDLRSPLNTILGFSELIAAKAQNPDHKKYAESIISAGKNLVSIFNDFSDVASLGISRPLNKVISLKRLMSENKQIVSDIAAQKKISVITESIKDVSIKVDNPAILRLIGYKAVQMAIEDALPGEMIITAATDKSDVTKAFISITYIASDTGESENAASVLTSEFGGLLSSVNGILDVTRKESGKTLSITFPIEDISPDSKYVEIEDPDKVVFEPAKLVIADDDAEVLDIMKKTLSEYGFDIYLARNGYECFKLVMSTDPDLVLTDVKMPHMSGYEVLEKIKSSDKWHNIPVIAITAHHSLIPSLRKNENADGTTFDGFLTKPIGKKQLIMELYNHLPAKIDKNESVIDQSIEHYPEEDVIAPTSLPLMSEIIELLENEMKTNWSRVSKSHIINDILSFGEKIRGIAEQYHLKALYDYAVVLLDHTHRFDMKNLPNTLKMFPEQVALITNICHTSSEFAFCDGTVMKALVAEDNDMNRLLIERLLTDMGFYVVSVPDGEMALDAFRRDIFDVVIIDGYMPEMDGFDTIRTIRKEEEKTDRYTTIIAVSGVDTEKEKKRFLEVGADDIIIKPFTMDDLNRVFWEHIKAEDLQEPFEAIREEGGVDPAKALKWAHGKKELMNEFFSLFIRDIDSVINKLDSSFKDRDFDMFRITAHRLKNSLTAVGADQAAETARQLEALSREILREKAGVPEAVSDKAASIMQRLSNLCLNVKTTLQKLLEQHV